MRGALDGEPILWRDIAMVALGRMLWNLTLVREQALSTLSQRTAGALVGLSRLQGVQESGSLQMRLSQDELGMLLGVSRQSANKELRALEEAGAIRSNYNRIEIVDLPRLIALAGGPAFNPASAL
jgi:CRP-like cAMP-binding protein